MTSDEHIQRLEQDKSRLMLLLGDAVQALPQPRRGRKQGDPIDPKYWTDRQIETLLQDIRDEAGAAS